VDSVTHAEAIARLRQTGEELPQSLRDEVLTLGSSVIANLIQLAQIEAVETENAPGKAWPLIHAVALLIDLKAEVAIEPLLQILRTSIYNGSVYNEISIRLPDLGAAVVEPALRLAHDQDIDNAFFEALCCVLSDAGVRDERIFECLCRQFENSQLLGAGAFANYGDERALPLLRQAIEDFEPIWDSEFGMLELREFLDAYEHIAGTVPDDLLERASSLQDEWETQLTDNLSPKQPAVSDKIGRNELCPCGSGKKYKKCCQT
jgi:hypothetical protein